MFKKTRRKIVASIMSILVLVWVGTLGIIYTSSYLEMTEQNRRMLKAHSDMFVIHQTMNPLPPEKPIPDGINHGFADSPMFNLSTFYTVVVSENGEIIEIKNDKPSVHSDEDLQALALQIIESSKTSGKINNLIFYMAEKDGFRLVSFMDNTLINENASTLIRYTFIFGGAALLIFFFVSLLLAEKIVKPVEVSYKKQKQFISDAGHELKTPVSIVGVNAELLSREIGQNQWLANIQYENERMGILVTQMLELARTENTEAQTEHIDLSRLADGEALPFESIAFEKGFTLNTEIKSGITVIGNSTQLKQLVSILLDNAIRHGESASTISLTLTKSHGNARLSVINKGEEIPKEQQEQLFDRFYRADMARNSDDKHYGLGLAIAKSIVAKHNGSIEIHCVGGLVEFRVQIPIAN